MRRTELLQEVRKMRFEEVLEIWTKRSISQEEAARMLGVSDRTFRRYIGRYEEEGLDGLYLIIFFSYCEERKRRGNLLDKGEKRIASPLRFPFTLLYPPQIFSPDFYLRPSTQSADESR